MFDPIQTNTTSPFGDQRSCGPHPHRMHHFARFFGGEHGGGHRGSNEGFGQ